MATIQQQKRGTSARWSELNPVLADGEIGYETDTRKLKVGDGLTDWSSLPYFSGSGGSGSGGTTTNPLTIGTSGLTMTNGSSPWNGSAAATVDIDTTKVPLLARGNAFTGAQTVTTSAITDKPLILNGVTGQTATLQEWQVNGSALATITNAGSLRVPAIGDLAGTGAFLSTTAAGALIANTRSATNVGLQVKGAASQSSNLQEWQNSAGNVLAKIKPSGDFDTGSIGLGGVTSYAYNAALSVNTAVVGGSGIVVRGVASQTADLQQWQNNSGTVLTKVSPTGLVTLTTDSASQNLLNVVQGPSASAAHIFSNGAGYLGWIGTRADGSRRFAFESNPTTDSASNFGLYHYDSAGANNIQMFTTSYTGGISFPRLLVAGYGVSTPSSIFKAVGSQTANITEWQNSSGTVLARVASDGALYAGGLSVFANGNTTNSNVFTTPYLTVQQYSTIGGLNPVGNIPLVIKAASGQTASLQEWQGNTGAVLSKIDANGNFTMGANLTFNNPGIGNVTQFTFTKTNDNAWIKVTERSSDQTTYEFGMADNPDGNDFFQWRFDDWQNAATGWMPIQVGEFNSRFIAKNNAMYGNFQLPYNSGFYTYNGSWATTNQEIARYTPSNSTSQQLPKDAGSGTGTITVDATLYNGVGATAYWVAIDGVGTFKWGTGSYSGTAIGSGITITGSPQTLSSNLTVTLSLTGHVVNDRWSFRAYPTAQVAIGGNPLGSATTSIFSKADFIGLAIRGAASQTANLQEWQNSSGTVLAKTDFGGSFYTSGNIIGGSTSTALARLSLFTANVSSIGAVIRGVAAQTANLQEWQDSAASVKVSVAADGQLNLPTAFISAAGQLRIGTSISGSVLGINNSGAAGASSALAVFQGASGQLSDALQIRNSSTTILGGRNANAQIYTGSTAPLTTTVGGATTATSGTGTTATLTTTLNHNLAVGDRITVAGVTPTGYNGTFIVTAAATNSVSYANATTGAQSVAGTVSVDTQATIQTRSAATTGLFVKGSTGQAGDFVTVQNATGTVLTRINSGGQFQAPTIGFTDGLTAIALAGSRNVQLGSATPSLGGGVVVIGIANATTVPTTNPTGGGILYSNAGALSWMGTSGSAQAIANADGTSPFLLASATSSSLTSFGSNPNINNPLLTSISTVGGGGSEGGQINFARTTDGTQYWSIDAYGSTSTPDLRVIENVTERFRFVSGGAISVGGATGISGQVLTSGGANSAPTWTTVSGTSSNSFTTIAVPSGTSPAAASSTDTLTFANGSGISITGSSSTDTVTVALATAYGDTVNPYASKTANYVLAAPNGSAGVPTFRAIVAADIPTLNQSTTGSAATLTTTRTIWGQNFNGSANVTGALTDVSNITAGAATAMTIKTIDSSSVSTSNVTISTGNSTASGSTSGAITIDAGTGVATTGSISIGTTNAGSIDIGRTGRTVTVTGNLSNPGSFTTTGTITRTALSGGGATTASFNNAGDLVRTASSARYKQDITDADYLYLDVLALQPKTFRLKSEVEEDVNARIYGGFIAEEVNQLNSLKPFVNYLTKENGDKIPDGIQYGEMVAALVSAIKHQDAIIEDLKTRIISLENR